MDDRKIINFAINKKISRLINDDDEQKMFFRSIHIIYRVCLSLVIDKSSQNYHLLFDVVFGIEKNKK